MKACLWISKEFIEQYENGIVLYNLRCYCKENGQLPDKNKVPEHLSYYEELGYKEAMENDLMA